MVRYFIRKAFAAYVSTRSKFPIKVIFSDGSEYQNNEDAPEITIIFKKRRAEWRAFIFHYVGFMESYRECDIDIEGKDALRKLIQMSYELPSNTKLILSTNPINWLRQQMLEWRQNNTDPRQTRINLERHYNMPAEFFHLMTGELYGYTEGYYETGFETQDEAQFKKYDYICRKLCLRAGQKVIEVGSAWGTMSMLMAKKYGAQVVNFGIISEQNRVMRERLRERGLEGNIEIQDRDARELIQDREQFDRYVSLGVYEHAGKDCQREWIESIAACLKPGGIGVMSMTTQMKPQLIDYLVGKYIWHGCYLPYLSEVLHLLADHDLNIVDLENVRFQYADTMEVMLSKLIEHWPQVQAIDPILFDERFKRIWMLYYLASIATLRAEGRNLQAVHLVFVKGRADVYPRTRNFLYEKPYDLNEIADYAVPLKGTLSRILSPITVEEAGRVAS